MKKSKEGSTLIVTIILFMFVTIVSIAFLSMITSNYYARVSENNRIQNLYGSDSGLDVTYNIIAKTVEAASVYGSEEVKKFKEYNEGLTFTGYKNLENEDQKILYALNADIEYWKYYNGNLKENGEPIDQTTIDKNIEIDKADIDKLINKVFKDKFEKFIQDELKISIGSGIYSQYITENNMLEKTTEVVTTSDAVVYVGKYTDKDKDIVLNPEGKTTFIIYRELKVESGYDDNDGTIEYEAYTHPLKDYDENKLKDEEIIRFSEDVDYFFSLTVTSEFQTYGNEENINGIGANQRVIEANYSIRVPDYSEVKFKESINMGNGFKDIVGLTIGGDMILNDVTKVNVTGDIFVQGTDKVIDDSRNGNRTYDKYSGGIILNNSGSTEIKNIINFNNNVFTRGTFNIKSNVDATIYGDLYARNIYAGNENIQSDNSSLTVIKEAVVNNDLTVNATNTKINLTDFYGINDKNIDEAKKYEKSSSIIINTEGQTSDYSVKISDKAYIMGVAHINTESGYQTGESVAVKGNYEAYSVPYPYDPTEKFIYDEPLQVLDGADVYQKAKHFYDYWNPINNTVNCGGVILQKNTTYSIGSVVYYETVEQSKNKTPRHVTQFLNFNNSKTEQQVKEVIDNKKSDYAKNVYNLVPNNITDKEALVQQYTNNLTGTDTQNVSDILTGINDLPSEDKNITYINDGEKMAIFAPEIKTVVIKGAGHNNNYIEDDYIVIDATENKNVNAVIVAGGNVIIDGDVNFRGNIIAQRDLEILKNSIANIRYDKSMTQDIQKNNRSIFNQVFGADFGGTELNNESLDIQSNSNSFLRTRLWNIIK